MKKRRGFIMKSKTSLFVFSLIASFIFACVAPFKAAFAEENLLTDLSLTVYPGTNVTELNFNWITKYEPVKTVIEIAPKNLDFEQNKETFVGAFAKTDNYSTQNGQRVYWYSNKVTVDGVMPSSEYSYRVGDGENWSAVKSVKSGSFKEMSAYVATDVHIIEDSAWGRPLKDSINLWDATLEQFDTLNKADMILSLGDQMQDTTKTSYLEGFFNRELLSKYPIAPINGNHDIAPNSSNLPHYTNTPNSKTEQEYRGINDYFFKYGNVLFVMLSLTDANLGEIDHDKTFERAIQMYPDYDWLVVCCHESIYGMHIYQYTAEKGDVLDYTYQIYKPYIDCLDKYNVDMVLTGHSHNYSRSYFMKEGEKQTVSKNDLGHYVDPNGTVYLNMGITGGMYELRAQSPRPGFPYPYLSNFIEGSAKPNDYVWGNDADTATFGVLKTEKNTLTLTAYEYFNPAVERDSITITKSSIEVPEEPKGQEEPQNKKGCGSTMGLTSLFACAFSALYAIKKLKTKK